LNKEGSIPSGHHLSLKMMVGQGGRCRLNEGVRNI
jgi:hypothetical protein